MRRNRLAKIVFFAYLWRETILNFFPLFHLLFEYKWHTTRLALCHCHSSGLILSLSFVLFLCAAIEKKQFAAICFMVCRLHAFNVWRVCVTQSQLTKRKINTYRLLLLPLLLVRPSAAQWSGERERNRGTEWEKDATEACLLVWMISEVTQN